MADGAHSKSAMPDPIHQFEIHRLWHIDLFGYDASFTNSALFMVVAVALIVAFLLYAISGRSLVPTRLQSVAETAYEFIANMVRESMGEQGMKFFPLVFTLFTFIFTVNMLGMVPGFFTVTSHVAVTAALAVLVFAIVLLVGFAKNGLGFLKLFVPSGVPMVIVPFVTMIEVISFLSRPVSHSIRLFANMLGGHITLKVFAGFIVMLLGSESFATQLLAPLPLAGAVGLMALEFLVAFLQAYVFTMLTCMYLNDALHPSH